MPLLDSQGRLFGKVSILDLGAGAIILAALGSIFIGPTVTSSATGSGKSTPIAVDVIVRGLSVVNPQQFFQQLQADGKTNIVIRNQPYGQVQLLKAQILPRTLLMPNGSGGVMSVTDTRPETQFSADALLTLGGNAQETADGFVLGNSKLKIGTPVELEGKTYRFNASVIGVSPKS